MRHLFPLLWLLAFHVSFAGMEGERFTSPSGRYSVCNLGDSARPEAYFELRTARGDVLFSANDANNWSGVGDRFSGSYAGDVIWSPGEDFVLFTFYDGKYKVTAIYSFASRKICSLGHVIDGWTVPVRWVSHQRFIVEHHWPMGGKARAQTRYRETYQVRSDPFGVESVHKTPETQDKEEEEDAT